MPNSLEQNTRVICFKVAQLAYGGLGKILLNRAATAKAVFRWWGERPRELEI
jgi:hypothetical protein